MIRFADPWWFALAPAAVALVWIRSRRRAQPAILFSSLDTLRGVPVTLAQRLRRILPWIEALGLLCLVVALARPQQGRTDVTSTTHGVAIQVVLDRSGSMREGDLDDDPWDRKQVRRLDVVKQVVRDFVDESGELPGRPDDLVGLVTFCGFVQAHCPLTFDHEAFLKILATVEIPEVRTDRTGNPDPRDAELSQTALADGLVIGVERLRDVAARSKVVVLLSDGRGNVGVASEEAGIELAKAAGVKVYTIAIGREGSGQIDEGILRTIAEGTGGRFFNASSAGGVLEIWREIDRLERSELESFRSTRWNDRFEPWLLAGLALVVLHRLLADTRFRCLP